MAPFELAAMSTCFEFELLVTVWFSLPRPRHACCPRRTCDFVFVSANTGRREACLPGSQSERKSNAARLRAGNRHVWSSMLALYSRSASEFRVAPCRSAISAGLIISRPEASGPFDDSSVCEGLACYSYTAAESFQVLHRSMLGLELDRCSFEHMSSDRG